METADRLDYQRIHQASLRENETKGEQKVRLKSMISTYAKKKTLQSKRYSLVIPTPQSRFSIAIFYSPDTLIQTGQTNTHTQT